MPKKTPPPSHFKRFLARRRRFGGDRFDEVWNGVYVLSPDADNQHQKLSSRLVAVIDRALGDPDRIHVLGGSNITDRSEEWTTNYRVPDVAVFLPGNPAQDRGTHWLGGPDLAVEILSRGDRSRKKFAFYARIGVRELMLIDRRP